MNDAGLIDFYNRRILAFKAHAVRAYAFAYDNVQPTGLPLRRDDVAANLVTALEITADLREYLAAKKLRQKH